jgi:serine/threonine protein kinase
MLAPPSCPDRVRLSGLLAGDLPADESARLAEHVDSCDGCQKALDDLTATDAVWARLSSQVENLLDPEPGLRRALAGLGAARDTTTYVPERAGDEPSLDFLGPTDNPEHLGRLGPYEILDVVGRGGMGVVLKAFDPALHRLVAVKVLAPQLATSPVARKRFLREARAAAAVNHENIITIYAVDEANGVPYLVMRYVAGPSLQQRLDAEGRLALPEVLRVARQIAAGLAAAHAQGLIHRDVKPANVLLEMIDVEPGPLLCDLASRREQERVRITDFGLARAVGDAALSQSGVVVGTPQYVAPEQISGGPVDHRSDLYSLGVLLYRMATGCEPFQADSVTALWAQHLFERPPRPSETAPGAVPPWLEHLILRLLQKDPADRPQTAEEVIYLLDGGPGCASGLDEEARLAALRRYKILDTDPEQGFDDLTFLAAHVCATPIALITLVDADRQWFKSKVGLSLKETARNVSFCTHTIREADVLIVRDALQDERFRNSPLVRSEQVRFYAGVPLVTPDGHALGALCVMDRVPRQLTADQVAALSALSRLIRTQLELRRDLLDLKDALASHGRPE